MNTMKEQLLTENQTQDISIISHLNFQSCRSSILQSYMYPGQYPLSIFVRHNLQLFNMYRTVAPWQSNQFFSDQELQTCSYSIIADTVEIGVLLTLVISLDSLVVQNLPRNAGAPSEVPCPIVYFLYVLLSISSLLLLHVYIGAVPLLLRQYICIFLLFYTFNYSQFLKLITHTREQVTIYITL